jgi:hypothetical protein
MEYFYRHCVAALTVVGGPSASNQSRQIGVVLVLRDIDTSFEELLFFDDR